MKALHPLAESEALENARSTALIHSLDQKSTADFYREQAVSLDKWLLASHLSVCGGSIIALLNTEMLDENSKFFAVVWFFVGLLIALVVGSLRIHSMYLSAIGHERASKMFGRFSRDGDKSKLDVEWAKSLETEVSRSDKALKYFQYFPFFCIVIGAIIAAEGLI